MTSPEINAAASEQTTKTDAKPTLQKRKFLKEYMKSALFLAAIYTLIINKAQDENAAVRETYYQQDNTSAKKRDRENLLPSMIYSGIKIIFYPTHVLWK